MLTNLLRCTSIAVAISAATLSISAVAEDNADLSNAPFEVAYSYLVNEGYTSINMINENPLLLSAFDRQGSQVRLNMNPKTGRVASSEYVHWMDN